MKIICLLKAVPEIVDEMEHIEKLSSATIQITPTRLNSLRDISNIIAFTACTLVLIFYEYGVYYDDAGNPFLGPTANSTVLLVIKVLGWTQFCTAILLMIGMLITRGHLIMKSGWRSYVELNRRKHANVFSSKKEKSGSYSVIKAGDIPLAEARMLLLL